MEITSFPWSEDREWLLTNGLGGYSSSTVTGLNTRKYHALLVAAFSPADRRVLLSKIDETVVIDGTEYKLSTNQYWDAIEPEGYKLQRSFSLKPFPTFVYEVPGLILEKTVFMPHGLNAVVVRYDVKTGATAEFNANFLVTSRDHHWVLRNQNWNFRFEKERGFVTLIPGHENPPVICIGATNGDLRKPQYGDNIVHGLFYRKELKRGYPALDDLFIGASLRVLLDGDARFFVVCSSDMSKDVAALTCSSILGSPREMLAEEVERRKRLIDAFYRRTRSEKSEALDQLVSSSDNFIIKKDSLNAVIAGYPWFGEWCRDALISLPGLCLATGRKTEAEKILAGMIKGADNTRLNCAEGFKSLDAPLWLFWAAQKYLEYTKDYDFVRDYLWTGMKTIIEAHLEMADRDGLIKTVSKKPMTWMDAVVDNKAVTLRAGKPVEIQALWYNALMASSRLARSFGEDGDAYSNTARNVKKSFNRKFWNEDRGYLFDVVEADDASVRPNALFAISLPFPVLDPRMWKRVVSTAEKELLTPYGLRTLSPANPAYRGSAQGNQLERDLSYHQGDVWPWLLGPFTEAYKRAYPGRKAEFFKQLLGEHIWSTCVGGISEVFDGDPPHRPEGCINQAWSVAEILRIIAERRALPKAL